MGSGDRRAEPTAAQTLFSLCFLLGLATSFLEKP